MSLGRAHERNRKIFHDHALQTLGKRGKHPFCFILDHLAYQSIFIPTEIQTGMFVQMRPQLGKQGTFKCVSTCLGISIGEIAPPP